jgi:predicted transcriptional regulator
MPTTAVSVKLTDEQRSRLARVAKATRRSSHFHMKEAVDLYLEDIEWQLDFLKEAEVALKDYEETGYHVTHDEMMDWARSADKSKPPQWHR